ncbi:MAG: DNA-processing protein DprA, partial [Actinomycetota bacterium]
LSIAANAMTRELSEREARDRVAAVALASLPSMTPRRLRTLVRLRRPSDILDSLESWRAPSSTPTNPVDALLASTVSRESGRSLGEVWRDAIMAPRDCMSRDDSPASACDTTFDVCVLGDSQYPQKLANDPEAPGVLFVQGDLGLLDRPCVGIIGTRHATAHGRSCARHFGNVLSGHGVAVVSGLARGIDVSAHRGVLQRIDHSPSSLEELGRPIGVVASGLDVVYPPEHGEVWADVARRGVLLSESPPGTEPQAFRFPLRNRIIAALCDVLVVVESKVTGGSMITVRAALERQVTVMAVPGSTSTRASDGTNLLIRDGASIAVEPEDVLAVLGIESHRRIARFDPRPRPSSADAEILELLGDDPMTLDQIVSRTQRDLGEVALALGRLEARGWLMCTAGWFEKLTDPN